MAQIDLHAVSGKDFNKTAGNASVSQVTYDSAYEPARKNQQNVKNTDILILINGRRHKIHRS